MKTMLIPLLILSLLFIPSVVCDAPSSIRIVADVISWTNGALMPYEININGKPEAYKYIPLVPILQNLAQAYS